MAAGDLDLANFTPYYEPRESLIQEFHRHTVLPEPPKLPNPWPWPCTNTPMAWKGQDLKDDHILDLNSEQLNEIASACNTFNSSGKRLDALNKGLFLVPRLADTLAAARKELHTGRGIFIIRGINPSDMVMRQRFITFAGLASHLAPQRMLQSGGKRVVHITDLSNTGKTSLPAPYRSNPLAFHADPVADIVAMFVIRTPAKGGAGIFCPVSTVYNQLASDHPDLLLELTKPDWPFDRPPNGKERFYRRPVIFLSEPSVEPEAIFSRGALIRSHLGFRSADLPLLTYRQNAALDALHFAAIASQYRLEYKQGDIIFFNNRRILHGREAFQDDEGGKRLLLRLWLRDEELAGTPPAPLDQVWEDGTVAHDAANSGDDDGWPSDPDGS